MMNCIANDTSEEYRQKSFSGSTSLGKAIAISILLVGVGVFSPSPAGAQSGGWRIGGFAGWGLIDHQVEMMGLPGVPSCCPGYDGGSGNGLAFGATVEVLFQQNLSLSGRLLYAGYSGLLETEEEELVTADRDTVRATFLHSIDASLSGLALETFVTYQPIDRMGVFGGVHADFPLSTNFHQEERILEPSNIRYENDSRIRMVFDGDLPDVPSPQFSLLAGLRYILPLNSSESMNLIPEVAFWHGLSPVVSGRDWQMRGLRFGLEFQFVSIGRKEPSSPLEPGENDLILPPVEKPSGSSSGSSSGGRDY